MFSRRFKNDSTTFKTFEDLRFSNHPCNSAFDYAVAFFRNNYGVSVFKINREIYPDAAPFEVMLIEQIGPGGYRQRKDLEQFKEGPKILYTEQSVSDLMEEIQNYLPVRKQEYLMENPYHYE